MKPITTVFEAANSRVEISHYGGQLLSWRAADGVERLYRPELLNIESGRALRGGVPICFPQFSDRGPVMKHGFARLMPWQIADRTSDRISLLLRDNTETRNLWNHEFILEQRISLTENSLHIELVVNNNGNHAFEMTNALHTYLRVDDVQTMELAGLKHVIYEDALDNYQLKEELSESVKVVDELDRVYCQSPSRLMLKQAQQKTLQIEQLGFADTVVWNPGLFKAKSLNDMPAEDWKKMLCVESAMAFKPFVLEAGCIWSGSQRFTILEV